MQRGQGSDQEGGGVLSRTLLVDADIFSYVAASATEGVYYFNGSDSSPAVDENLDAALDIAKRDIEDVANKLKATRVIVCLTDEHNFRLDVLPSYKSNRKDVRKPSTLRKIKDFYAANYECYQRPSLEADDCMGILSTHKTLVPGERIIVSTDKDMQTIPGLLFNPNKDQKPRRITEVDADRYFMQQTLTGDATDGYKGCPGIGPKSPYVAALADCKTVREMWEVVLEGYASKGLNAQHALTQARCARILRASDWDFSRKAPRLWTVPFN